MRQAFVEAITLVGIEYFIPVARVRDKGELVLGCCQVHAEVEARIRASPVTQWADLVRPCNRTLATQQWRQCHATRCHHCCGDAANLQKCAPADDGAARRGRTTRLCWSRRLAFGLRLMRM